MIACRGQETAKKFVLRPMLTKLKYVGVKLEDLLEIYTLYIRGVTEYCSAAFHWSLNAEQSQTLERIQRTCLRIILGDNRHVHEL